ncbi:platelet glycoprotein Ib alpha chain isoform X2 [Hippoglossus hippoglossus]|uniref:platelet glycoprotein Ib alpha chain isoform X2 n=1 Tax=Hippoglossus hippoglossus TaxID=8267 RepID=UPI00148BBAEB|nr:platelet glycoprotein Ib alpha chain isoform X2 [Hippoglossus hippoglossus]
MQLVLLLCLLSHVARVTAVAGCHSDRDKDHRPRMNCTAAGFSAVPAGFEPTTKVLLFPRNLFSSVPWSSFKICPDIYEIDLTGNQVPEVTPSAAPILPTLSVLRLGWNHLGSIPDGSFTACPALTELYLDNNNIDALSNHSFSGLSKLEILELSSNHIKVLPELLLHPVPAIEILCLEINKIKVMPDNWFSTKEEVPYLYLSANPWVCSCDIGYLHGYIDDYANVYVRDGIDITPEPESVICDSPQRLKGQPLMSLNESDWCPTDDTPSTVTSISSSPATTITAAATVETTMVTLQLHTVYHRVVTSSWYQTFTSSFEWSSISEKDPGVRDLSFGSHLPSESPASTSTAAPMKARTIESVPSTVTSTTPKLQLITATAPTEAANTPVSPWVFDRAPGGERRGRIGAVGAAGLFCFWLFAVCVLLCVVSVVCILATLARLVDWYRKVYKPLNVALARRGGGGGEGVRLLTYNRREEKEVAGGVAGGGAGGGGGGGVVALYRSVLFIHREEEKAVEREERVSEGERGGRGGRERLLVTVEPTGEEVKREDEGERGAMEERGVYRQTLYRLLSKEEAISGWRDVMEECRVPAEDGGAGGGEASRKRYSVILREERGEAGGGREELEWVVGGWEVKGGWGGGEGAGPRSSWGEWLANYLPSMPWGVTMPPEGEAAQ